MPKINVRVTIPKKSPDKLIELNKKIIEQHEELGAASPLNTLPMDEFKDNTQQAEAMRNEAAAMHAKAQALNQKARILMGIEIDQNRFTEGTAYNTLLRIRNLLLIAYQSVEETLSIFGFNVVIRKSKMPKKRKKEDNKGPQGKV